MRILSTFIFIIQITYLSIANQTITVPQDYSTIQGALYAANNGTIINVEPGTYFENIVWPDNKFGIQLLSTQGREVTIIDGSQHNTVLFLSNGSFSNLIDPTTVIDGFTIRNGVAEKGGGLLVQDCAPTLRNLIIEDNMANGQWAYGGGAYVTDANGISISNCIFKDNLAESGSWAYGGGLHISGMEVTIEGCTFENNEANGGSWSYGAGLYIRDVVFESSIVNVKKSHFINNFSSGTRPYGSGLYCNDEVEINIENCLFTKNKSSDDFFGGSIIYRSSWNSDEEFTMINCTVVGNEEGFEISGNATIANSIIWSNSNFFLGGWDELNLTAVHNATDFTLEGEGNINDDPLFFSEDDLRIKKDSPCLNAGSKDYLLDTDILGNPRPMPIGSAPDIGAFEIDQYFSHIRSRFYFDENQNGSRDATESFLSLGAISVNQDKVEFNKSEDGIYSFVEQGEASVEYEDSYSPLWRLSSNPNTFSFDVEGNNWSETVYFGISPVRVVDDLQTSLHVPILRCNRIVKLTAYAQNFGTTRKTGILWVELDELVSEISFENPPDYEEDLRFGWEFESLVPGETYSQCIFFKVPGVDQVELGDKLKFKSEVLAEPDCKDEFCYEEEVRCSFDPNDKMAFPQREDNLALIEDDLTYTIRFQNVGNDVADDVLVIDTLDPNLDVTTLKLIASSHPENLRFFILEDRILHFEFNQIFLPDSTSDEAGSNGFVMYNIHTFEDIPEETKIENTAHIYFDFNPSIVTNTTENILVTAFPIEEEEETDNEEEETEVSNARIYAYPNPSSDVFKLSKQVESAELYNTNNQYIKSFFLTDEIDLTGMIDGVYILRTMTNRGEEMLKLVLVQ